jgi:hypothetical protein
VNIISSRQVNLKVPLAQHDALTRKAAEQNMTVQALIRAGITGVTGVPDPMRKWTPPKS